MRVMPWLARLSVAALPASALALTPGAVLGHGVAAPEPRLPTILGTWLADPLPWLGALLAAAAYLVAVRQVNGRHPRKPVPRWRVAAWLGGVALGLLALVSAIDVYADDLLWVHMVQHLLLSMVVPPLLALGTPITLLLRVSSPSVRQRLLLPALHSRLMRVVSSPLVAWPVFSIVMWATHFSPLYDAALENETVHVAEHLLFLAAGVLFWWPVVAADPAPRRMGHAPRVVYLLLQMPVGAAVGLAIYFAPTVLYPHYATIERSWGPSPLIDQQIGGLLMWGAGGLVVLVAVALIVADWMQADMRRSRRADLRAARGVRD